MLSVIITRDIHHDFIPRGMTEAFLEQSLKREKYEIIVPLKNNNDIYESVAKELKAKGINVKLLYSDLNSRSKMTNLALDNVKGDIILFLAEDFVPSKNLLSEHYKTHQRFEAQNVTLYGAGKFPKEITETSDFSKWLEDSGELFGIDFRQVNTEENFYFYFGNSSIKRSLADLLGPIEEEFTFPCIDDYEYGERMKKLGAVSLYLEEAQAIHDHALGESERSEVMLWAGFSTGILFKKINKSRRLTLISMIRLVLKFIKTLSGKKEDIWSYRMQLSFTKGLLRFIYSNSLH